MNKELEEKKNAVLKETKIIDMTRGCIIKIPLDPSNKAEGDLLKMNRQEFKQNILKDFIDNVAYVDVEKNTCRILIRCKSPEAAFGLIQNAEFLPALKKSLLGGQEENIYFEKISSNRQKKMDKKETKAKKKVD